MASMIPAFRLFLGGRLGSGRQWFPWIHLEDVIAATLFVIDHPELSGPLNFCAPQPVRNTDLTSTLAKKLNRPVMLPTPSWVMTTLSGNFGKPCSTVSGVSPQRSSSRVSPLPSKHSSRLWRRSSKAEH